MLNAMLGSLMALRVCLEDMMGREDDLHIKY